VVKNEKEPLVAGHFSQKSHKLLGSFVENDVKIRYPLTLRHPVAMLSHQTSIVLHSNDWYPLASTQKSGMHKEKKSND